MSAKRSAAHPSQAGRPRWRRPGLGIAFLACALPLAPLVRAVDVAAPARTLARVNGEPITLDDLLRTLAEMHGSPGAETPRAPNDPMTLLERLITTKLVAQEAREMGFAELPDFTAELATFRRNTLVDLTLQRPARRVAAADPAATERLYRVSVGEAKLDALFFDSVAEATALLDRLAAGAAFESERDAAVAGGAARGGPAAESTKLAELHPSLAAEVLRLETGSVSRAVPLEGGAAVLRLVELRVPEDAGARERAGREALEAARLRAVGEHVAQLEKAHARTDRELLDAIDFDVDDAGFERLTADTRTLVAIEGAAPITVGDLATALRKVFFHGVEKAALTKKISARRDDTLHDLVVERLVLVEAATLHIAETPEFLGIVRAHEEQMLFRAAVESVILPEVRVTEPDIAAYYEQHGSDYLAPQVVELAAMAFEDRPSAERTLEQLRRGADWRWALDNAPGRLPESTAATLPDLSGKRLLTTLPEEVQRGTTAKGDLLVYAPDEGPAWVLAVRELPARRPLALDRVRGSIEARLREERAQDALTAWTGALREAAEVERLVAPDELRALVLAPGGRES